MPVIPLITALFVGLLQGLLEWLPISSQGNLVLLMVSFLGFDPVHAVRLSVYLHMGTGLAALIYFREDIIGILHRDSEQNRSLFRFLVVATVITGAVGLPVFLFVRVASFHGEALLALTGVALVITGLVQRRARVDVWLNAAALSMRDGVSLGLVQGFSVIPGLSRSGLTTSVLLLRSFSGEEAFRISFLMSVPAVFAAALGLMLLEGAPPFEWSFLVALVASFLSALLAVDVLLRLARRIQFWSLCVFLGVIALLPPILYLL